MSETISNIGTERIVKCDDPAGVESRKIDRLKDDIAHAGMFGDDTAQLHTELQSSQDMVDYLNRDDIVMNTTEKESTATYESMSLDSLYNIWADAEDRHDRTISTNIQDILLDKLEKQDGMSHNLRAHMIDIMHGEMMRRRKVSADNAASEKNIEISADEPIESEIDHDRVSTVENSEVIDSNTGENIVLVPDSEVAALVPEATHEIAQTEEAERIKLVLNVDTSVDTIKAAERAANERIQLDKDQNDEKLKNSGPLRKIMSNIWQSATHNHRFRVYRNEEARKIRATESDVDHRNALFEQFSSEYAEMIHTEAGEKKNVLSDSHELSIVTRDLISRYCKGEFSDDKALDEARSRMIEDYRKNNPAEAANGLGEGLSSVSNLLEIAKAVSGMVEHGQSIENVLSGMDIIVGEARSSVRTEKSLGAVEETFDKIARSRYGSAASGATLIAATSIAMSVGRWGGQTTLGALTKVAGFSVVAAAVAGVNKSAEWKNHRANNDIDRAEGRTGRQIGDKVREALAESQYDIVSAKDIISMIENTTKSGDFLSRDKAAIEQAIEALAWADIAIKKSDKDSIDLIGYSDPTRIILERMMLDKARAEARVTIKRAAESLPGDSIIDIESVIMRKTTDTMKVFEADIVAKDAKFERTKNTQVMKAVISSAFIGASIGIIGQEIGAAFDPTRLNIAEQAQGLHADIINGQEHKTMLAGLFGGFESTHGVNTGINTADVLNGDVKLIDGSVIHNNNDGTIDVLSKYGTPFNGTEHVPINPDGSLPESSINLLNKAGLDVIEKTTAVQNVIDTTKSMSVSEFTNNYADKMTEIHRTAWMDNDTMRFDKNELKLDWGSNGGVRADGGYELDISGMTDGGSVNGSESINIRDSLNNSELKLAVSVNQGSQHEVFMIPIDQKGKVVIPANSPVAALFGNNSGQSQFHGGFAEVIKVGSIDGDGSTNVEVLATLKGANDAQTLNVIDKTTEYVKNYTYDIITPGESFIEASPVVPIEIKDQMKSLRNELKESAYHYTGGEYISSEELDSRRTDLSPRLESDPNADLNLKEEADWYRKLLAEKRGQEYIDEIESAINTSPELMGIDNNTEAIVKIPVNAAGESEANNIYNVIKNAYAAQDKSALDKSLIVLHVNWFDKYPDGVDAQKMMANIEKTRSEIARAKADCPDVRIATIETEWKRAELTGGIIGKVSRKLNDVVLLAINSAINTGRMDPNHDVLLIRNDADPKGISRNYLSKFIDSFRKNPQTDVFTGTTSFDNKKAKRLPGLVFVGNFMQSINLIQTARENGCHTGGANFGVRASALAAVGSIGFGNNTGAGSDDVEVGRRIKSARKPRAINNENSSYLSTDYIQEPETNDKKQQRKIGMRVFGARIDTDSDREELLYLNGVPIIDTWNSEHGFSSNGYKSRNEGLRYDASESIGIFGFKDTLNRIQNDMERTINVCGATSGATRTALSFTFPSNDENGKRLNCYEMTEFIDENGQIKHKFRITRDGAEYLKKYLRSGFGKTRENYGDKKMRQLYGRNNDSRTDNSRRGLLEI